MSLIKQLREELTFRGFIPLINHLKQVVPLVWFKGFRITGVSENVQLIVDMRPLKEHKEVEMYAYIIGAYKYFPLRNISQFSLSREFGDFAKILEENKIKIRVY